MPPNADLRGYKELKIEIPGLKARDFYLGIYIEDSSPPAAARKSPRLRGRSHFGEAKARENRAAPPRSLTIFRLHPRATADKQVFPCPVVPDEVGILRGSLVIFMLKLFGLNTSRL